MINLSQTIYESGESHAVFRPVQWETLENLSLFLCTTAKIKYIFPYSSLV